MERSRIHKVCRAGAERGLLVFCIGVAALSACINASATVVLPPPPDYTVYERCPGGPQWKQERRARGLERLRQPRVKIEPSDPALRDELLRLAKEEDFSSVARAADAAAMSADAAARSAEAAAMAADAAARAADEAMGGTPSAAEAIANPRGNVPAAIVRLRQIVEQRGYPGVASVGEDGVQALWRLVEMAESDPDLQMRAAEQFARPGADEPGGQRVQDATELIDRLLSRQGRPQRYGTVYEQRDGAAITRRPVENEARLDARRAELGLMPAALELCIRRDMGSVDGWLPKL